LGGKESSMQGTTRARITRPAKAGINAAIWIEPGRALVARGTAGGAKPTLEEVSFAAGAAGLAEIAHRVGEADHVLVLGRDDLRLALEREIVAIGHHPERIREEVVTGATVTPEDLVARLRRMPR
jgi:hypothetical protein